MMDSIAETNDCTLNIITVKCREIEMRKSVSGLNDKSSDVFLLSFFYRLVISNNQIMDYLHLLEDKYLKYIFSIQRNGIKEITQSQ